MKADLAAKNFVYNFLMIVMALSDFLFVQGRSSNLQNQNLY